MSAENRFIFFLVVVLAGLFLLGLATGNALWADPGRCDKIVGSQSSVTAGNVRELTVTCLVERVGP